VSDKIRVLRVLEYTYDSMEAMALDMQRWGVQPTGYRKDNQTGTEIRSSYMLPEFMPGMAENERSERVPTVSKYPRHLMDGLARYVRLPGTAVPSDRLLEALLDEGPKWPDKKISFIKEVRVLTNLGLKEAKDAVEGYDAWVVDGSPPQAPF
jgi:Ribosomal protein L7/L12 C-terminal domain